MQSIVSQNPEYLYFGNENQDSEVNIMSLAPEQIEMIFFYVNDQNNELEGGVCKQWNNIFINITLRQEFNALKSLVEFSVCHLDSNKYSNQKNLLQKVITGTKFFELIDLLEVKPSTYDLRESILNILKQIDSKDLKKIDSISKNENINILFNHDLAGVIETYKKFDVISKGENYHHRYLMGVKLITKLYDSSDTIFKLIEYNLFEKAFELQKIEPVHFFLKYLHAHWTETKQFNKALDYSNAKLEFHLELKSMKGVSDIITNMTKKLISGFSKTTDKYKRFISLIERLMAYLADKGRPVTRDNTSINIMDIYSGKIEDDNLHKQISYLIGTYTLPYFPLSTCYDLMLKLQSQNRIEEASTIAAILIKSDNEEYIKKVEDSFDPLHVFIIRKYLEIDAAEEED